MTTPPLALFSRAQSASNMKSGSPIQDSPGPPQRLRRDRIGKRDYDAPPEQGAEGFVEFVDSFNSPWVGMYYDIGNHWKYGQPGEWIRTFGYRCAKLDVKGFSRAKNKFVDITSPDDDLPWDQVRKALDDIGFSGWATAEVGGGDLKRLTLVREQMQKAFGVAL